MASGWTKLTPERQARLVSLLKSGQTRQAACRAVNIAPLTLRKWLAAGEEGDERWAEFAATVREAEAEAECRAVVQIQLQGKDDWRALAWWLERRFPQAWGDQRTVNVKMTQERDVIFDAIAKAMTRRGHGDAIEDILAELAAGSGEETSSDPTAEDQRH